MSVPAFAREEQEGPHTSTSITINTSAVEVDKLVPLASNSTSQKKITDLMTELTQKLVAKSPPGLPIQPLDLSEYQNEDLQSVLDTMNARINMLLTVTRRHVTIQIKGAITDLDALIRTIQLLESVIKEAPSRNIATQTEAQPKMDRSAAPSKRRVLAKPPTVSPSTSNATKVRHHIRSAIRLSPRTPQEPRVVKG